MNWHCPRNRNSPRETNFSFPKTVILQAVRIESHDVNDLSLWHLYPSRSRSVGRLTTQYSKLWTERYTHHTSHFTVSTNLISFTPHPLSRGLLTSTVPASLQPDKDIKKARVYIPVSYGIYTLLKFSWVKQLLFCSCGWRFWCHYSDSTEIFIIIFSFL